MLTVFKKVKQKNQWHSINSHVFKETSVKIHLPPLSRKKNLQKLANPYEVFRQDEKNPTRKS